MSSCWCDALQMENPSEANDEGITALHNSTCAGHFDVVKFLVEFGCDVNAADTDGWFVYFCYYVQCAAKKWPRKIFPYFLSNCLEFNYKILCIYLLFISTYNCQVTIYNLQIQQSYWLSAMITYRFLHFQKCFLRITVII